MLFRRKRIRRAFRILHEDGILEMLIRVLRKTEHLLHKISKKRKVKPHFLAKQEDVLKAQWTIKPYRPEKSKVAPPYTINWVMSPPRSGGGHQNIYRFIKYLEDKGHSCRVYL